MMVAVLLLTSPVVEQWRLLLDGFQDRGTLPGFSELRHACLVLRVKGKGSRHCSALFSFLSKTTALILSAAGRVNAEDSQLSPFSGIALVQSEMNHPR